MGNRLESLICEAPATRWSSSSPPRARANIQPRWTAPTSVLKPAGFNVKFGNRDLDALTSATQEAAEKAFLIPGARSKIKGVFAVDAGSTALLGPSLAKTTWSEDPGRRIRPRRRAR